MIYLISLCVSIIDVYGEIARRHMCYARRQVCYPRLGLKFLVNSKQKWFRESKKKDKKNSQFNVFFYEGHDSWHTR